MIVPAANELGAGAPAFSMAGKRRAYL